MNKRKVFLLMLVISVILIVALISRVYAAQTLDVTDYLKENNTTSSQDKVPSNADEYEELEDETKTDEDKEEQINKDENQTDKKEDENKVQNANKEDNDKKTENTNKTENENKDNSANTINGQHATTGVFNNVIYISAGIISLVLIILVYKKLKKYNF